MDETIIATGFEITVDKRDDQVVRLSFCDEMENWVRIVTSKNNLPSLLGEIQKQTGSEIPAPSSPSELSPGQQVAIQSTQVSARADGSVQITFVVDIPNENRVVTIPLTLTAAQSSELASDLQKKMLKGAN